MRNRNMIQDERIMKQIHIYGYQSFGIILTLLLISIFIKLFILNLELKYWIDTFLILLIACAYFTARSIIGGVLLMPDKAEERVLFYRRNLIGWAIGSIVWGLLMFTYELFYSDHPVDYPRDIVSALVGMILFFSGTIGLSLLITKISSNRANKDIE